MENDVVQYEKYFDMPNVIKVADNIFEAVKNGNELLDNDEKIASVILAYSKLCEYYSKK